MLLELNTLHDPLDHRSNVSSANRPFLAASPKQLLRVRPRFRAVARRARVPVAGRSDADAGGGPAEDPPHRALAGGLVNGYEHTCRRCRARGTPHVERHGDASPAPVPDLRHGPLASRASPAAPIPRPPAHDGDAAPAGRRGPASGPAHHEAPRPTDHARDVRAPRRGGPACGGRDAAGGRRRECARCRRRGAAKPCCRIPWSWFDRLTTTGWNCGTGLLPGATGVRTKREGPELRVSPGTSGPSDGAGKRI